MKGRLYEQLRVHNVQMYTQCVTEGFLKRAAAATHSGYKSLSLCNVTVSERGCRVCCNDLRMLRSLSVFTALQFVLRLSVGYVFCLIVVFRVMHAEPKNCLFQL